MRVGITGPIGSGKSFVATSLQEMGYPVYSADEGAKDLANRDMDLRRGIVDLLGEGAYGADGAYDRRWVASRVFSDASLLALLNGLIHPAVFSDYSRWCQEHRGCRWLFFESALLPRLAWRPHLDAVIAVIAPEEDRIARVMRRDATSRAATLARMEAQAAAEEYVGIADFTIINSGTQEELTCEVERLVLAMEERYA